MSETFAATFPVCQHALYALNQTSWASDALLVRDSAQQRTVVSNNEHPFILFSLVLWQSAFYVHEQSILPP